MVTRVPRIAFIPFICAGDPDLDTTSLALRKLDEVGADVIELGVPYSVRRADGLGQGPRLRYTRMCLASKPAAGAIPTHYSCTRSGLLTALQDPLADGPVIQNAATRALEKQTTLDKVIEMVRRTAPAMKAPLVMFTYYNPIMRKGLDNFCRTVKEAGAAGATAS